MLRLRKDMQQPPMPSYDAQPHVSLVGWIFTHDDNRASVQARVALEGNLEPAVHPRSLPQISSGGLRTDQTQELGGLNLANTEEMFGYSDDSVLMI